MHKSRVIGIILVFSLLCSPIAVALHGDIQGVIDPFGPPSELGLVTITVPNPFGGDDIPLTL